MTGFGRAQGQASWGAWVWEVRSVNGKSVDGRVSYPPGCEAVEFEARRRLKDRFARGNFQLQLRIEPAAASRAVTVDRRRLSELARLARTWSAPGTPRASVAELLSAPGVIPETGRRTFSPDEAAAEEILKGLAEAFDALDEARAEEGAALTGLLTGMLADMDAQVAEAVRLAERQPVQMRERLKARLEELAVDNTAVDPERLAQEMLVMANKADVREEIDRLTAHIAGARKLLSQDGAVGRKLDFLCQEFNREANTMCSKSASLELTNVGLALKSLIDQFREQVQNVE